jgi:hypothetical protein
MEGAESVVALSGAGKLVNLTTLSDYGSYSPAEVYTPDDCDSLVEWGRAHGVRIVPEFDTPGHSWVWGRSPELKDITQCDADEDQYWPMCPEPPCGFLNPGMGAAFVCLSFELCVCTSVITLCSLLN